MDDTLKKGEALFAAGNLEGDEKCFLSLLDKNTNDKVLHNNLGVIAYKRNAIEGAREHFEQAIQIDPGYREALDNFAALENQPELLKPVSQII